MTAEQLAEWEAYNRLEPIGDWKNDIRMATIAAVITNLFISVYGKKGTKMVTIEDFMPAWYGSKRKLSQQGSEEIKAMLMNFVKEFKEKEETK